MRAFLRPAGSGSGTPKAGTPQARTPGTPDTECTAVAEVKLSLSDHGGRRAVPKASGTLAALLIRYKDGTISTAEKRAQPAGQIHLLSQMETVSVQLGDFAGCGGRGNAGNLKHLLSVQKRKWVRSRSWPSGRARRRSSPSRTAAKFAACTSWFSKQWATRSRTMRELGSGRGDGGSGQERLISRLRDL